MASTINPDAVSVLVPTEGTATTQSVRDNFSAIKTQFTAAAADVEDLQVFEAVAGGAGFVNVSGAVTIDLSLGRAFHHTATGNLTGPTFTNVPTATLKEASWSWVLRIDVTGGYTLTGTPTVTFVDGRSFADADMTADAENVFTFWTVGAKTYGSLITNGTLAFDPYKVPFDADGAATILTEAEKIDAANTTTYGTGTLELRKNGVNITAEVNPVVFALGDRLGVVATGVTGDFTVRIPRYSV